jgi:hypothetical protein
MRRDANPGPSARGFKLGLLHQQIASLFDHLVGKRKQRRRYSESIGIARPAEVRGLKFRYVDKYFEA